MRFALPRYRRYFDDLSYTLTPRVNDKSTRYGGFSAIFRFLFVINRKKLLFTVFMSDYTASPCNKPLGLQNHRLPNSRITASSEWNQFHAARLGRLGQVKRGKYVGAWCTRYNNHLQWFKVDFGRPMKITKVATQGRQDTNQWVTSFYLSSSQDNVHWEAFKFRSVFKVKTYENTDKINPYNQVLDLQIFCPNYLNK